MRGQLAVDRDAKATECASRLTSVEATGCKGTRFSNDRINGRTNRTINENKERTGHERNIEHRGIIYTLDKRQVNKGENESAKGVGENESEKDHMSREREGMNA